MSEPLILFAPTRTLYTFLTAELGAQPGFAGVKATGRIPNPRPARFVRVRAVGGVEVDVITAAPTLAVESYAATDEDAEALGEMCHALILRAGRVGRMGAVAVRTVDVLSRPQQLPDPVTDQSRYSATYSVLFRGVTT